MEMGAIGGCVLTDTGNSDNEVVSASVRYQYFCHCRSKWGPSFFTGGGTKETAARLYKCCCATSSKLTSPFPPLFYPPLNPSSYFIFSPLRAYQTVIHSTNRTISAVGALSLAKVDQQFGHSFVALNIIKGRYQTQIPTLPTFFSILPAFTKNEISSWNFWNLNKRH